MALLRALGLVPRADPVAYPGWAWIAGSLGVAALEFVALALGLGVLERPWFLGAGVLLCAAALFFLGRGVRAVPVRERVSASPLERFFFGAVLVFLLFLTARMVLVSSQHAIVDTDEAVFWSHRAKILFATGGFGAGYREALLPPNSIPHADYPLLDPLLQLWTFAWAGRITHVVNRLPIQLVALALVLCSAAALRRAARPSLAALWVLLLPATTEFSFAARHAYADVLVATGLLVGLDAYLRWRADGEDAWLRLASLALAFALWSKHDALLFACALVGAAVLVRAGRPRALVLALRPRPVHLVFLAPLSIVLATWIFNLVFSTANSLVTARGSGLLNGAEKLPLVLRHFWALFTDPEQFGYAWLAFFGLLLAAPAVFWRSSLRLPAIAVLLSLAGLAVLFCSIPDIEWHLETAASRLFFQLFPALLLLLGAAHGGLLGASAEPPEETLARPPGSGR